MTTIKLSPNEGGFRLELFEWSNQEQKEVCMGDYSIYGKNGQLVIEGFKNWRTNHRDSIVVHYYLNEPKFSHETLEPFGGVFIQQLLSASVESQQTPKKETL